MKQTNLVPKRRGPMANGSTVYSSDNAIRGTFDAYHRRYKFAWVHGNTHIAYITTTSRKTAQEIANLM